MAKSEQMRKVQNIIDSVPLEEILETAEAIAPLIPVAGDVISIIIKIIRVLIAVRPAASKTAEMVAQNNENDAANKRDTFNRLWAIAMTDGEISEEEKEFLRPHAIAAGISKEEFELMVINHINL